MNPEIWAFCQTTLTYMTNRGFASGPNKRSTMAPAFLLKINGDTTEVGNVAIAQGD